MADFQWSHQMLLSATQAAREELQAALALAEGAGQLIADWEMSEMRCQLACVYRASGGELWADRQHAHALLLQAAAVEGPAQVQLAHAWLSCAANDQPVELVVRFQYPKNLC